jgi:hypothetical protein
MKKIEEVFVVLENRPGATGELCRILKKKRLPIHAIGVFADTARIYVPDPQSAKEVLESHGYQAEIRPVLRVDLPNRIGALMELTTKLGNAGINIEYFYGTITEKQKKGVIILEVDNMDLALDIFHSHDF